MAEDANNGSASSANQNSQTDSTSQGGANSTSQTSGNEGFHNHPRWIEREMKMKSLEQQNSQMVAEMNRLKEQFQSSRGSSSEDEELVSELRREFEMDETQARKFVAFNSKLAEKKMEKHLRPLSETALQTRVEMNVNRFINEHPDVKEFEPEMVNILNNMNPYDRSQITRMSDGGLSTLYEKAKLKQLNSLVEKSKNEGRNEAYENKQLKQSMTSGSSASSAQEPVLSESEFAKQYASLSEEELRRNPELYDSLKRKLILGK